MKPYSLSRLTGYDLVAEIARRRRAELRRKIQNRCYQSNACDCPRCKRR
jgi:hypothetical protein